VPEPGGVTGSQIEVAAFGSFAATHQKGLGNLDGDGIGGLGGDPLASTSCTDVHFGDIDALAETGCFLRDPRNPNGGAAIIQGQIRLNGLEIIPDAGAEIVIDPRRHTINTTGSVRVVLRAPGIGDITLYHGELHVSLAGSLANAGNTLFDFDTSTASGLKGFPFDGSIDVEIQHDAVVIPVSLRLPSYFGGITGQATLPASNATGLQLSSLHVVVPDVVLGALEVKDVSISYTQTGNVWAGSATVNIPAGTPYFGIGVSVRFDDGDFTMGSFRVNLPFPGVPIFTDAYLDGFGGGFDIHPSSRRFFGSITVGAIPLDAPNYTIDVTGTVSIRSRAAAPLCSRPTGPERSTDSGSQREADLPDGRLLRGGRQRRHRPQRRRGQGRSRRPGRPPAQTVLRPGRRRALRLRRIRRVRAGRRLLDRRRCLRLARRAQRGRLLSVGRNTGPIARTRQLRPLALRHPADFRGRWLRSQRRPGRRSRTSPSRATARRRR
jgi:hypothetical protein